MMIDDFFVLFIDDVLHKMLHFNYFINFFLN